MKKLRYVVVWPTPSPHQKGIVLFIALIALLMLSLTAVALIRSVDTATVIAGNLALKQSTASAGEGAAIEANRWLQQQAAILPVPPATTGPLDADNPAQGYFATLTTTADPNVLRFPNTAALMASATWTANGMDYGNWMTNDNSNNRIRYIIERMCLLPGSPDPQRNTGQGCVLGPQIDGGGSRTIDPQPGAQEIPPVQPLYRITARVQGPRDTMSYIQTFVY